MSSDSFMGESVSWWVRPDRKSLSPSYDTMPDWVTMPGTPESLGRARFAPGCKMRSPSGAIDLLDDTCKFAYTGKVTAAGQLTVMDRPPR